MLFVASPNGKFLYRHTSAVNRLSLLSHREITFNYWWGYKRSQALPVEYEETFPVYVNCVTEGINKCTTTFIPILIDRCNVEFIQKMVSSIKKKIIDIAAVGQYQ